MFAFTQSDVLGSALAFLLFPLILLVPGYAMAWAGNAFDFRRRTLLFRIPAAVVISIAATPILLYWLARAGSMMIALGCYAVTWVAAAALALGALGHPPLARTFHELRQLPRALPAIAAIWFVLCILALADIAIADRLYFSVIVYDHGLRVAVTDAITRTGIPPANPFFHLTGATPLRYHYFWFALCSAVDRLGGTYVDARHAINAGVIWCGYGLMSLVALYLRLFDARGAANIGRRALLGIGLLSITGLDLVPSFLSWLRHKPSPEMEWWNEQVSSWLGATLWVPHNIAAMVAGFTAFLLIWHAARECETLRARLAHTILAGLAFASCAGLAFYVALVFAASMSTWVALAAIRRLWKDAIMLSLAGVLAAGLALPYLMSLSGAAGTGGSLLQFSVRAFFPLGVLVSALHLQSATAVSFLFLLFLPLNYALEFGFYMLVAIVKAIQLERTRVWSDRDVACLAIAAPSLLLCTFLRSGVISNNDFGWRGLLLAQFVLLLWAAEIADAFWFEPARANGLRRWRPVLALTLIAGCGATLYELAINRFYFPLADAGIVPPYYAPDREIGKRTAALRTVYERLRTIVDPNAVLEVNPKQPKGDFYFQLYSRRQMAASGLNCGTEFGGDPDACADALPSLIAMFQKDSGLTRIDVAGMCQKLGIDVLVVADTDPVWKQADSWIWQAEPIAENHYARAFLFSASAR